MFIKTTTHRRGGKSYRYVHLAESFRPPGGGPPKHRVVANLGNLSDQEVDNLRVALQASKRGTAVVLPAEPTSVSSTWQVQSNLRYLDVAVFRAMWDGWGLTAVIEELVGAEESVVAAAGVILSLTLQRSLAPGSKLYGHRWFPTTALPELLGIRPEQFHNTRIHRVLDTLHEITPRLLERLPQLYQQREGAFAYCFMDCTKTHFEGRSYDQAQRTVTKDGSVRKRIVLALLANQAGYPLRWRTEPGRTNDIKAMGTLAGQLKGLQWLEGVPVVFDRAMGDEKTVQELKAAGIRFVTAAHVNAVDSYLESVPPRFTPAWMTSMVAGLDPIQSVALYDCQRELPLAPPNREPWGTVAGQKPALPFQTISQTRTGDTEESYDDDVRLVAELARQAGLEPILDNLLVKDLGVAELHNPVGPSSLKPHRRKSSALPFLVRLVAYFNPQMCIDQRRRAQKQLSDLNEFVGAMNEELKNALKSRREEPTLAKIRGRLEAKDWLGTFEIKLQPITVTNKKGHAVQSFECRLELNEQAWMRRRLHDGFVLLLAHPDLLASGADLARMYRAKDAIEKDFQSIKSTIKLRPVFHYTDPKVQAHVTLCMLALLLQRTLEARLRSAGLPLTAEAAIEALSACHLNQLQRPEDGATLYAVTQPSPLQQQILEALGLTRLVDQAVVTQTLRSRAPSPPT